MLVRNYPSASTFPKTTEFEVLTPRQMQVLMETYDSARKSYSKSNCFYFQTLIYSGTPLTSNVILVHCILS